MLNIIINYHQLIKTNWSIMMNLNIFFEKTKKKKKTRVTKFLQKKHVYARQNALLKLFFCWSSSRCWISTPYYEWKVRSVAGACVLHGYSVYRSLWGGSTPLSTEASWASRLCCLLPNYTLLLPPTMNSLQMMICWHQPFSDTLTVLHLHLNSPKQCVNVKRPFRI